MRATLLNTDGSTRGVDVGRTAAFARPSAPLRSRVVYAAAHVIPHAHADNTPGAPADIDWDATLGFRRTVWGWGLGVADAMDTAQRNMGLDPPATRELITRSADAARSALKDPEIAALFGPDAQVSDLLVAGVSTDHRSEQHLTLAEIIEAYREQLAATQATGAGAVMMASRHLARTADGPEDYRRVYREVLAAADEPVILHWLGTAFDPQLAGYFGSTDTAEAAETLLAIMSEGADQIRGVKMSLLDDDAEIAVRKRLPAGTIMLTGDDYHFAHLITGDGTHGGADGEYSHALLGAFAATPPAASAAIQALDHGDAEACRRILEDAEPLARHVFAAPTFHYKTGVAFLSWLNGHQRAFQMIGGMHGARSLPHLSRILELAAASGNLEDPPLAIERWHSLLHVNGISVEEAP
ncbi:MAG: DUF993 family protein [Brachybacterium sp.]|nr:DUF993 family protein [Brachybacterium sp.]